MAGAGRVARCPLCGAAVADVAAHFGSDDCPPLVTQYGAVTAAGRRAEREQARRNRLEAGNHYQLPEFERIALANDAERYKRRMNALAYERKTRGMSAVIHKQPLG